MDLQSGPKRGALFRNSKTRGYVRALRMAVGVGSAIAGVSITAAPAGAGFLDDIQDLRRQAEQWGDGLRKSWDKATGRDEGEPAAPNRQQPQVQKNRETGQNPRGRSADNRPEPTFNSDRRKVAQAQDALNRLGYPAGTVDGQFGNQTRGAILAFEADHGLPATGDVTDRLIAALEAQIASNPSNARARGSAQPTDRRLAQSSTSGGDSFPKPQPGGMVAPALGPAPIRHPGAADRANTDNARPGTKLQKADAQAANPRHSAEAPASGSKAEHADRPTPGEPVQSASSDEEGLLTRPWGVDLGMRPAQAVNTLEAHGFRPLGKAYSRRRDGHRDSVSYRVGRFRSQHGPGLVSSIESRRRIRGGAQALIERASGELGARPECAISNDERAECVWKSPPLRPLVKELRLWYRNGELALEATAVGELEAAALKLKRQESVADPVRSLEGITIIRLTDTDAARSIRGHEAGYSPYLVTFFSGRRSYAALGDRDSRSCMAWAAGDGPAASSIKLGRPGTPETLKLASPAVCQPFTLTLLSNNLVRIDAANPIARSAGMPATGPARPYSGTHEIIAHVPLKSVDWDMEVFSRTAVKGVALGPFSAVRQRLDPKARVELIDPPDKAIPIDSRRVRITTPTGDSANPVTVNGRIYAGEALGRKVNTFYAASASSRLAKVTLSGAFERSVAERYGEPSRTAKGAAGKERLQWFYGLDGRQLDLRDMGPANCIATRQHWIDDPDLSRFDRDIGPWGCSLVLELTSDGSTSGKVRHYSVQAISGHAMAIAHFGSRLAEVERTRQKIRKIRAFKPKL